MNPLTLLRLLILVAVANGAPVIVNDLLGNRFSFPIDGRFRLRDGQPVFGASKTIRGILISVLSTVALAPVVGFDWTIGLLVGITAMAGDLFSSFVKRRWKLAAGARATGMDRFQSRCFP